MLIKTSTCIAYGNNTLTFPFTYYSYLPFTGNVLSKTVKYHRVHFVKKKNTFENNKPNQK